MQHRYHLIKLHAVVGKGLVDLLNGNFQQAVVVDGVNNGGGNQVVEGRHGGEVELPEEVILERIGDAVEAFKVAIVAAL